MGNSRLPKSIYLLGTRIKVKEVPKDFLKEHYPEVEVDGVWEDAESTIYIYSGSSIARKRYMFMHELIHAANDVMHDGLISGKLKA